MLKTIAPDTVQEYIKPEGLDKISGVLKSKSFKFQTRQDNILSMKVSEYAVDVAHLENHGEFHLNEHMFFLSNIQTRTIRHHSSNYDETLTQDSIEAVGK